MQSLSRGWSLHADNGDKEYDQPSLYRFISLQTLSLPKTHFLSRFVVQKFLIRAIKISLRLGPIWIPFSDGKTQIFQKITSTIFPR